MTPANMAAMCSLAGLQVVALTDHNGAGNCKSFAKAARTHGLIPLCGMELCTREEIHLVCLFPHWTMAMQLQEQIHPLLPPPPKKSAFFGAQLLMDDQDGILGEEPAFLSGAADIGCHQVWEMVRGLGGIAFPAHVDRGSFSLLSVLGFWDDYMGFPLAEQSIHCRTDLIKEYPSLEGVPLLINSDAHSLDQIPDAAHYLTVDNPTPQGVIDALLALSN